MVNKSLEFAMDVTGELKRHVEKVEEGTTEEILEYLAFITGEYHVALTPPTEEGKLPGIGITFRATNEELGIAFLATPNGHSTTIREAALYAVKGAIAWYQPWKR